ncbi:MAG TPA: BMP family ABC transporter substrate-binding protein, partial [Anaerolineaceae bacterium]|nr:BMP family ABC transporter substrate-binding protein [Anaerolineaceae bacterium]
MKQTRWIGQTLNGRYKIEDLLGQGGMSAVYKATDPNLRRVVAIKIVHPHLSTDPSFIRRFEEEAAAIASLRHPNIVQVFDFNSDEDVNYMVMEFVPGETLQTRLKRLNSKERKMSFEDAINITINVCEGLSYAHKRGMVHRDVKPANIMLDINNQAILMDFGIVKIVGSSAHTLTGAVIGTANYMAPEIIRSEPADQRSDIYSLGITLFEMLSGSPPFDADSAMTIMMMHLNDPLPNLFSIRNDIPYDLIQIVNKTLAKDRNDRYQSADDFAKDLRRILQQPQTNEIQIPVDPIKERKIENEEQPTMVFNSSQSSLEDVTMIDHSDRNIVEDVTVVDFSAEALSDEVVQDTLVEIPKKTIDSYDPKSGKQKKIIGVILALVLIGVSMIGFFTSWFGLGGEKQVIEKPQPTQQQANSITQNNSQLTLSALTVMSTARAETVKKTENPQIIPAQKFKVCQLTDMGSIYDSAFQETVYNGILNAKESFGINVEVLESSNEADYENNLAIFVESKCDLIVSSGYLLGDITLSFVQAHPEIYFSVVDFDFEGNYHNLVCQVYQIDEAAFLAGYLAARMTETGKVATYGGMPLQPVKLFMDGFTRGVDYYNRVKGTNVQVIGWEINEPDGGMFVNSFENMDLGVEIGNELINQNVDVIFPVAGQVGIGTAIVMRERKSGYIIGVDSDWAITNPELAPVILTSVLKNTNITTYEIIKKSLEGQFEAGKYVGSLNNDGVSLAPYYEMEQRIPVQIRNEIQEIRE